jgi:RNA polymerase sigma-70 factor (ECF subfamily)
MSEIELMRGVASGDQLCVSTLVDAHYDPIYRLLRHLTGSNEEAEDLSQDVFLTARERGSGFRGASSLRTWLTRLAVNAYSRHCRREKLRRALHLSHSSDRTLAESDLVDAEWLLAGLRTLSPVHRATLLLFDVHEYSIREVAEITGSPEGTVKARLHYARKKLREALSCPEEG